MRMINNKKSVMIDREMMNIGLIILRENNNKVIRL